MKLHNFLHEQPADYWEEWLEKLHNFFRETGTGIGCCPPICEIFPANKVGKVYSLYAIFEGNEPRVGCQVKSSI